MKIRNYIRIVPLLVALSLLLSFSVSAALPPSAETQWENTKTVTCEVFVIDNLGTVSASIVGYTGSTVQATATLYEILPGLATIIYTESTPENNPYPVASFVYEFEIKSGATYYLVMDGVVSMNGVDEEINRTDVVAVP